VGGAQALSRAGRSHQLQDARDDRLIIKVASHHAIGLAHSAQDGRQILHAVDTMVI